MKICITEGWVFLKLFVASSVIWSLLLALFSWQDLYNEERFDNGWPQNFLEWLKHWFFWEINYILFLAILSFALATVTYLIYAIVRVIRLRKIGSR